MSLTLTPDLAELTRAWARGWAVSRGLPAPVEVSAGLVIGARYVLDPGDWPAAAACGRELTAPGTEIKLVGATARLRAALPESWKMYDPNQLMTVVFARGVVEVPASCTARIVEDGGALLATIHDSAGDVVSRARLAASGRFGVVDRVRTRSADQRRGLGRAVMTMLGNRALEEGLIMGLLSATADGRGLYGALGWTGRGEMAGAVRG